MQLTDRQKKIRELILKDSFISAQQMSVVLSVVTRTIWRDLADLQKKGGGFVRATQVLVIGFGLVL
ncbi:HTH domain-containing protein [Prevotella sp. khp1]|uniref:HTH domain-containing protein n=1 Tax=Prevotella sp. khp1 TaxID=1761884 RepID=UPI00351221E9